MKKIIKNLCLSMFALIMACSLLACDSTVKIPVSDNGSAVVTSSVKEENNAVI